MVIYPPVDGLSDRSAAGPMDSNRQADTVPPSRAYGAVQNYREFTELVTAILKRVNPELQVEPRAAVIPGDPPKIMHHLRFARPMQMEPKARQRPPLDYYDERGRTLQVLAQRAVYMVQFDCVGRTSEEAEWLRDWLQAMLSHYTGWLKQLGVQQLFWDEYPASVEPTAADAPWVRSTRWQVTLERLWPQPDYTIQRVRLDLYQMTELVENELIDRSGSVSLIDRFSRKHVWKVVQVGLEPDRVSYWEPLHYLTRSDGLEWLITDPPNSYYVSYCYFTSPDQIWLTSEPKQDQPIM